jgi:predicted regulator of Ras-like GTPase activity (Roadblock/LC7/MglB family)
VTEDIKTLTTRLAEEPSSLAFLDLGEALRRRGQFEAAYKVARGGISRYPSLAEAHDLLGRILGDQGDLAGAFDAWAEALRFDRVRRAVAPDSLPGGASVSEAPAEAPAVDLPKAHSVPVQNGHVEQGVMLVDSKGLRLNGTLLSPTHDDVGDRVAAELAGVSREATRTSRLLGLGTWEAIAVESPEGTVRDSSLPMARLGLIAERAARHARAWLESHG